MRHIYLKGFKTYLLSLCVALTLLFLNTTCFAQTIVVKDKQLIDKPTQFKNVRLDLTQGEFVIDKKASLDIQDSIIDVIISPSNPFFVKLLNGSLILKNNKFNVSVSGIIPNPNSQALYNLILIEQGNVHITGNDFTIATPYTVGLLKTDPNFLTNEFLISNNIIKNFHGGLYLSNSHNAQVCNNTFSKVSFSNIYNKGTANNYSSNIFLFPGNLVQGDAFDIINSDGVSISNNVIASSSSYGIFVMGASNLIIDNNKITDGLSYGIFIQTPTTATIRKNQYLQQLVSKEKLKFIDNVNISIANNLIEQNRFGLAAEATHTLIVTNNTFIQRFADSISRKFWTNNDNLLTGVADLTWLNNFYKEAFTQEVPGDNNLSLQIVSFPAHGGVSLP